MLTKNKRLLKPEQNREYYSKSDSNFMDVRMCSRAHQVLDRVAWVRDWVHKLDSRYHLDVGCKDGYTCLTLASEGLSCIGIDPSEDAILEAHTRALELDIAQYAHFTPKFLEDLEPNSLFDTVSMMEVLEHVVDAEQAVAKLAKLGRYILITTPDAEGRHGLSDSDQNEEHVRIFTKLELDELVSKYATIMESVRRDEQLCVIAVSKEVGA